MASPFLPPPPPLTHLLPQHPLVPPPTPAPPNILSPIPITPQPPPVYPPYMYGGYPDHHYYYFLQQQLLLLHHHHYLQSQAPPLNLSVPNSHPVPNLNFIQSLENSVKNIEHYEKKIDDVPEEKLVDHEPVSEPFANNKDESSHCTVDEDKPDDNAESENVENDESFINIEEVEEEEPKVVTANDEATATATNEDEKITAVDDDKPIEEEDTSGLFLLADSIDRTGSSVRKVRFASTDCTGLQILCDVANSCEKVASTRIERSKSLDLSFNLKCTSGSSVEPPEDGDNDNSALTDEIKDESLKNYSEMKLLKKLRKKKLSENLRNQLRIKKVKKKTTKIELKTLENAQSDEDNPDKEEESKNEDDLDDEEEEKTNSYEVPETDDQSKNVNILTSFKETFQRFKQSYLSKHTADSKLAQKSKDKKIPTLENWTTIMQEKKLKIDAEKASKTVFAEEAALNNNVNKNHEKHFNANKNIYNDKTEKESEDEQKHCCISDSHVKDEDFKTECEEDLKNNNDFVQVQSNDSNENDYMSFKKKIKLKKKYKNEQFILDGAERSESENASKKKKKRKKEKKDRKEREEKEEERSKSRKEEKKEKSKKDKDRKKRPKKEKYSLIPSEPEVEPEEMIKKDIVLPSSCSLSDADLKDGLRVLLRLGGHFYTSRLTEISPPDIYGIVVDKERGNKPHILSREEVLQRAVNMDIYLKTKITQPLPSGS